jgi:hypothetical protein
VKISGWVLKSCENLEAAEILPVAFQEGVVALILTEGRGKFHPLHGIGMNPWRTVFF